MNRLLLSIKFTSLLISMRLFHPLNSSGVTRNLCLILLSKLDSFQMQSNINQKISKILRIPNMCLLFPQLQLLLYQQYWGFSLNKNFNTYLTPWIINWQLISPDWHNSCGTSHQVGWLPESLITIWSCKVYFQLIVKVMRHLLNFQSSILFPNLKISSKDNLST